MDPFQPNIDPVSVALAIRRGAFRLENVRPEQRAVVAALLQRMTDAQVGTILNRRERAVQSSPRTAVAHTRAKS